MTDELDALRIRWAKCTAKYTERMTGSGITATLKAHGLVRDEPALGIVITVSSAPIPERVLLSRCAQAPADIRALLDEIDTLRAALAAQAATNAELLRRLAHEQSLVERGALLTIGVFRMVLLDIADKSLTILELRRRLFLARREQPEKAMHPHEVAAYINGLVTDGPGRETLTEEADEDEAGGTDG